MLKQMILVGVFILGLVGPVQAQRVFDVMDNQGFEAPIKAYSLNLPAEWTAHGEILWLKPCSGNDLYELVLTVAAPDGRSGFRVQPGHQVIWTEMRVNGMPPDLAQMMMAQAEAERNKMRTQFRNSNCHVGQVRGTEHLLKALVLAKRPDDVQVLSVKPNEAAQKAMRQTFAGGQGMMNIAFDAVQVDMRYLRGNVRTHERLWLSWYQFSTIPNPNLPTDFLTQQTVTEAIRFLWMDPENMARDEAVLNGILASFKVNPAWQSRINEVHRKMAQDRRRNQQETAAQREQARREADLRNDQDHRRFLDMIAQ